MLNKGVASHRGNNDNECCTTDDTIILLWGNSFLAKRTAIGLVKFGIVATVTVGGMDAAVEPSGTSLWRVTGETVTINATQLSRVLSQTTVNQYNVSCSSGCSVLAELTDYSFLTSLTFTPIRSPSAGG
ncbi:hypothetical protein [Shewanella baltica]|uniref:hypothetical protein n=1 Tax=Shewanella baltica TaxID=62322 RepID=UPI00217EA9E1|nr:hypothetical protein [Shewanella baltica]MCS6203850.1 hypothetical protein [Shewanella baltica]